MEITEMLKWVFQHAYVVGLCAASVVLVVILVQSTLDWMRHDRSETVYGTLVRIRRPKKGTGITTCYYDVEINNKVRRFKKGTLFEEGNVGEQHALKYDPKRKRILRDKNLSLCYMITVPIMLAITLYVTIWEVNH